MGPSVPVEPIVVSVRRPEGHIKGSDFARRIMNSTGAVREGEILHAILDGHVPESMLTLSIIEHGFIDTEGRPHRLTMQVTQDYMTVGTDSDRFRVPLWPTTTQTIADAWGCMLPTTTIVDIIWSHSNRIDPQPWGPPYDASMSSTSRFIAQNSKIEASMRSNRVDPSSLVAGHKKDVVLTNQLIEHPESVFIYGWHKPDGVPIQGLPLFKGHSNKYADYSHGSRLVARDCVLDGEIDDLCRIVRDPILHVGVSREGPLRLDRQPA